MKTQYLCLPLTKATAFGGSGSGATNTTSASAASTSTSSSSANPRVPPAVSILERFRVAVFRLIMVTALSKRANNHSSSASSRSSSATTPDHRNRRNNRNQSVRRPSFYLNDPYPSEAMADCIEFIKKSSVLISSLPSDHQLHNDGDCDDHQNRTAEGARDSINGDVLTLVPVLQCT